jgi:hypothetical protein
MLHIPSKEGTPWRQNQVSPPSPHQIVSALQPVSVTWELHRSSNSWWLLPDSAVSVLKYISHTCATNLQNFFIWQNRNVSPLKHSSLPSPWTPEHHYSTFWISMNYITLDTSHKWNYTVFFFLWMTYFTWHNSQGLSMLFLQHVRDFYFIP